MKRMTSKQLNLFIFAGLCVIAVAPILTPLFVGVLLMQWH